MKKRSLVLVAVSLLLFAGLVPAQEQQGRGRRSGQGNPPGGAPDPQQMIQQRIDRLASELSLTEAQKTQAATIFANAAKAAQPLNQQVRETRQSLQEAIKANNTAQIDQLSTTFGTQMGQVTAINSKAEAQFISILTPEQQAKLPSGPLGLFGGGFGGFGGGFGERRGPPPNR
jgi:Spy/CpxP family protein refolding chaperone